MGRRWRISIEFYRVSLGEDDDGLEKVDDGNTTTVHRVIEELHVASHYPALVLGMGHDANPHPSSLESTDKRHTHRLLVSTCLFGTIAGWYYLLTGKV